jgi:hypothetical protein
MVDLDFEEQLKETNFPDLLDGTQPSQQFPKKKVSSRRKVEKEKKQIPLDEKRRLESADRRSTKTPIGITIPTKDSTGVVPNQVDVPSSVKLPSLKHTKQLRVSVDPPVSPASGFSSSDHRDDSKSKHSSSSSSKLTAANIEKFLTPPLDGAVDMKEKKMRGIANKVENNIATVKKLSHKSIKRDFIEQVTYDSGKSKTTPVVTTKKSEEVPILHEKTMIATDLSVPSSPTKNLTHSEILSPIPKLHGINELEFKHQIDSKSSSVSSIPHEGSHECDDDCEEDDDDDVENMNDIKPPSPDEAQDLLERARDRIARQRLVEQVKALEMIVERKNAELEQLNGQLRRAIETKSDLVIAHNEIEKRHAIVVEKKEQNLLRMKQANIWLLEAQSIKEKELLNEIIRLTDMTRDAEEKRREELDDWERMHRNEMLEKDYTIARLSEELRKLGVTAESPIFTQQQRNNLKGFYDPTSIITGASKFFFH